METLHKVETLVNQLFIGLVSGFPNKDRVKNWSVYENSGKLFVRFQQIICYGEGLKVVVSKKYSDTYLNGIENFFLISGNEFINQGMGFTTMDVWFCINDLRFIQGEGNGAIINLFLDGSEFHFQESPMPISWTGQKPIAAILPNTRGCYTYFYDKIYDNNWALAILEDIQNVINTSSHSLRPEISSKSSDENQTEKALDELRKLLG